MFTNNYQLTNYHHLEDKQWTLDSFFSNYPSLTEHRYDYPKIKEEIGTTLEKINNPALRQKIMNWVVENIKDYGLFTVNPGILKRAIIVLSSIKEMYLPEAIKLGKKFDLPEDELAGLKRKKCIIDINNMNASLWTQLTKLQVIQTEDSVKEFEQQVSGKGGCIEDVTSIAEYRIEMMKVISNAYKNDLREQRIENIYSYVKGFFQTIDKNIYLESIPYGMSLFVAKGEAEAQDIFKKASLLLIPKPIRQSFILDCNKRRITLKSNNIEYRIYSGVSNELSDLNSILLKTLSSLSDTPIYKRTHISNLLNRILKTKLDFRHIDETLSKFNELSDKSITKFYEEFEKPLTDIQLPSEKGFNFMTIQRIAEKYINKKY